MKFRRLKLTGFKSFVEPADLRIEPGLTGVVGPNGCGKSNLLEALRWVMGEGSPKSLRGGGMDDVIFAGTAQRPPRDFAEVTLLVETAEQGEREVTRRIERGAGSAYRIDGRDVRQKDVALLFADAATGAHSPALVSQGRISAVIAARPAERRQMLEEAAGIAGLHVRRKDAEQKLRATEVNLQRLDELLGEQEARAGTLRRQARTATRYRSLSDRIRLSEARLLHARWAEAGRAAIVAAADAESAGTQVEALGRKLHEAEAAQAAAAALVAERRQAAVRAREEGQELAHRLAASRAALDTASRRLADLARHSVQIEAEREREAALQADASQAIASLQAEQLAIAARLDSAESEQQNKTRALGRAEERHREAEAELASLLTREAGLAAGRQVAEAAVKAAQGHADRLGDEARRLDAQLAALGSGAVLIERRDRGRSDAATARSAIAACEGALAAAEEERRAVLERRAAAEATLATAKAAHSTVEAEVRTLEQALAITEGEGLLAALAVAPGFEQALAAALGDDLAAPLGREQGWTGSEPQPGDPPLAPGLSPLADHVKAPPELARRLAQVGVVETDDGRPLALGQRLVTKAGRLRRWDGFVSHGQGAVAAQRLERANRLAALGKMLPALSEELARAQGALQEAGRDYKEAGLRLERARAELRDAERGLREAERQEGSAAAALERHEEQEIALRRRLAELAPLLSAAAAGVADAAERLARTPDAVSLGADLAEAREAAARTGREVADLRAEIATAARILVADRERQISAAREAAAWSERSSAAGKRIAETTERASAVTAEQAALQGEPERLRDITRSIEQQMQGSSAIQGAALAAEREAEAALAELGRALARANEAMAAARETRAAAAARADAQVARRTEYSRVCGEKFQCPPPLLPSRFGFVAEETGDPALEGALLEQLTAERERLGPVNLVAEQELAELEEGRLATSAEREELGQAIHRLRGSIGSLNREGRARLLEAYAAVDRHFRSLFTTLFNGGQAHLSLIDSDDPLEAGLEIMAQPPGKRLAALSLLSGGEQALTAVALIFALFLTKPSPICVLDEVDAPLDDANVERFCDLLVRMTAETDTRYLIVTHNAVTMSRMHRLYGVTMIEQGVSRLVSVDLRGAEQLLAAE